MTKKLNPDEIRNDLEGSVFFPPNRIDKSHSPASSNYKGRFK